MHGIQLRLLAACTVINMASADDGYTCDPSDHFHSVTRCGGSKFHSTGMKHTAAMLECGRSSHPDCQADVGGAATTTCLVGGNDACLKSWAIVFPAAASQLKDRGTVCEEQCERFHGGSSAGGCCQFEHDATGATHGTCSWHHGVDSEGGQCFDHLVIAEHCGAAPATAPVMIDDVATFSTAALCTRHCQLKRAKVYGCAEQEALNYYVGVDTTHPSNDGAHHIGGCGGVTATDSKGVLRCCSCIYLEEGADPSIETSYGLHPDLADDACTVPAPPPPQVIYGCTDPCASNFEPKVTTIAAGGTGACSVAKGGGRCCCTYPVDPDGKGIDNGDESGLGFNSETIAVCAPPVNTTTAETTTTAADTATAMATTTAAASGKINSGGPDEAAAGSKNNVGGPDTNATKGSDGGGDGAGGDGDGSSKLLAILLPLLALLILAAVLMVVLCRRKKKQQPPTAEYAEPAQRQPTLKKVNSDYIPANATQSAINDVKKSNDALAPRGISLRGPGGGGKRVGLVANVLYSSSRGEAVQNETYANLTEDAQAAQNNTYDAWGQGQGYAPGAGGQGPTSRASSGAVLNATYAPADPTINRDGAVVNATYAGVESAGGERSGGVVANATYAAADGGKANDFC